MEILSQKSSLRKYPNENITFIKIFLICKIVLDKLLILDPKLGDLTMPRFVELR